MKAFENFLKGLITTLLGLALMCGAAYEWWVDYFSYMEALGAGGIGFALCFMRTKLDDLATEGIRKMIEKFTK